MVWRTNYQTALVVWAHDDFNLCRVEIFATTHMLTANAEGRSCFIGCQVARIRCCCKFGVHVQLVGVMLIDLIEYLE